MIRITLVAISLTGLLAASAAQADSLAPGSETAFKSHDAAQHFAVATGAYGTSGTTAFGQTHTFGYPSSERSGGLVPGSESFFKAADATAARSIVIGKRSLADAPSIGEDRLIPGTGSR